LRLTENGTYTAELNNLTAEVNMAGPNDGSPRRRRQARATGPEPARRRVALAGVGGPWQWQWRHNRRRRRAVGCFLWMLTLLIVLLVLSILFGGFHRGARVGGAPAHVVRSALIQDVTR
jgi:hypothetical protein